MFTKMRAFPTGKLCVQECGGLEKWQEFTCLNSLRDVEPTVKLILHDAGLDEIEEDETNGNTEDQA